MVEIDISLVIIGIVGTIGAIFLTKMVLTSQNTGSKYLKAKMKEMEDYTLYQKKMIQHYKNKASNMEKPPVFEGDPEDIGGLIPEIIGDFSDFLPKWAQPLLKDKQSQQMIIKYLTENPDKAKSLLGKLVGKKGKGNDNPETSTDSLSV